MRHVRMLGLCLVAALAMFAVVAASSALALKNPTTSLKIFANCPFNGVDAEGGAAAQCIFAATEAATATEPTAGGQYTVGGITVPLEKQITLQYATHENADGSEHYIAPTDGAEAITPTPEKVPGEPIAHITQAEQEELGWPATLKFSYAQAQKHGLVKKVFETIELAGIPFTSRENILTGEGVGVEAPVKIKGESAWIGLLGDVCYIGSDAEPIVQHLTSGETTSPLTGEKLHGARGEVTFSHEFEEVWLTHSILLDNTYAVPVASCTGPYGEVIAATLNKEFHLPQPAGASVTEIKGTLYDGNAPFMAEKLGL